MRIDIISLFPEYFQGPFDASIVGRARRKEILDLHLIDLREFGEGTYRQVDDRVYGGGPGMVLMPGPIKQALAQSKRGVSPGQQVRTIYLSPQGKPLTAEKCRELSALDHLILLCGHYEGIDQRIIDTEVDEEISIGDYVLTNGCLPAIVLVDGTVRFIPGVIGHSDASRQDSFENVLLDCPHYTRPEVFEGEAVPPVLLEGHHGEIARWRHQQALEKTRRVRPDLYVRYASKQRMLNKISSVKPKHDALAFGERGVEALTLSVEQLRRSRRFYREVLGLHLIQESPEQLCFALGQQHLRLVEGAPFSGNTSVVLERSIHDPDHGRRLIERVLRTPEGGVWVEESTSSQPSVVWLRDPDGYEWRVRLVSTEES